SAGGDGAEECFFERAPDRAVAGTIDNAEFYDLVLQQPQGPACSSLGRLGTGQGNQLGLLLAVKNPSNARHRARLAAQHGLEAFFHQLFAHPINHGWAGFQSFDDPVVAPPFASFRDKFLCRRDGTYPLEFNAEHMPNWDSRVLLGDETDPFGMPRLIVQWQMRDSEVDWICRAYQLLATMAKASMGTVQLDPDLPGAVQRALVPQGGHSRRARFQAR